MFTHRENQFSPLFLAKTTSPLCNSANFTPDDAKPVKLTQISIKFQHLAHPRTVSERDAYAGKDVKKALYMTNFKYGTQEG